MNCIIIFFLIISLFFNYPSDSWTGGNGDGFKGFFVHQNTLAAFLLFSSVFILIVKSEILLGKIKLYQLILSINFFFILISYSRASILSFLIFAAGYYLFFIYPKSLKYILSLFTIVLISVFFIEIDFLSIIGKGNPSNILSNRLHLWDASLKAAYNNWFIGIGFGVSDPSILLENSGSYFIGTRYFREKGNGFLSIIEETGLVGFLLFFLPLIYYFIKQKDIFHISKHNLFILLSLFSFFIHAFFEAWFVGITTYQLLIFYLFIIYLINEKSDYSWN